MPPAVRHLRIHGRVQGVGYRFSMTREATRLGLSGWVRNRLDGSVEAMVAGPAAAVDALVAWARRGPAGAAVTAVQVQEGAGTFDGFEQRPSA
jgi:acylphosphatase